MRTIWNWDGWSDWRLTAALLVLIAAALLTLQLGSGETWLHPLRVPQGTSVTNVKAKELGQWPVLDVSNQQVISKLEQALGRPYSWQLRAVPEQRQPPVRNANRLQVAFAYPGRSPFQLTYYHLPHQAGWLQAGQGPLYQATGAQAWQLQQLLERVQALRQGELLAWPTVNQVFPRGAKATVIDVATGKRFDVQRRAGSRHADVQPLTAGDTRTMKAIYGGHWSWDRRAVIVVTRHGGRTWRIAASMNGQPHGAGAIQGNDFPGHSCLHFLGSEIHRTRQIDERHLQMILKAAGIRVPGWNDAAQVSVAADKAGGGC